MKSSYENTNMLLQLTAMLELQDEINLKVHPDWRSQGFLWYRAVWTECAEMLEHYGWKWWKQQAPNIEQVKLELIDVFHFGMSSRILDGRDFEEIAEIFAYEFSDIRCCAGFCETLEDLVITTMESKTFSVQIFAGCMKQVDMTFDELYCGYVSKNVLNFFRQDHGYQDGSYQKIWQGKEDNQHLIEILTELDANSFQFADDIYQALEKRYPKQA